MAVDLTDVYAARDELVEWHENGGESEDEHHELVDRLEKNIEALCAPDGNIDSDQVKLVNSMGDLNLQVEHGQFKLELPALGKPGQVGTHRFSPS